FHLVSVLNQDGRRHPEKQAGIDDARYLEHLRFQVARIRQRADLAIENEVAVVANKGRTVGRALPRRQGELFQPTATGPHAKRHHFDRQPPADAEDRHDLLAADEDYETPRSAGDNFLTHQRSAQALDEIVLRINFIGAVHVDVDLLDVFERD